MAQWKLLVGACVVASVSVAATVLVLKGAGPEKSETAGLALPAQPPVKHWAFPAPLLKSVPDSKAKFSEVQMYDRTNAVDWFPESHPAMPGPVKGALAVYACGFCHLPQGAGRSENAALAGLPAAYIMQQIADIKSGARKPPAPDFGPAVNMNLTATQVSEADAKLAADYFASLKYTKHLKLVESADVPPFHSDAFVYVFDKEGKRAPLGDRIIEGPDDFERFEMRDPNVTFTAYVPVGSVARGAALAKGDGGARPACDSCHGPGLTGTEIAPPIAGRLPTGLFRQIRAFHTGTRAGAGAALMKPIADALSEKDMVDLAAYVASLEP